MVEAGGVADFLEPDGVADSALHAFAVGGVRDAAGHGREVGGPYRPSLALPVNGEGPGDVRPSLALPTRGEGPGDIPGEGPGDVIREGHGGHSGKEFRDRDWAGGFLAGEPL